MKREKWDKFVERLVAIGVDKWMHIVLIMVLAWLASVVFLPFGLERTMRRLIGMAVGVCYSLSKEIYDKETTGVAEKKDLVADGIGLVLFFLIHAI